MTEVRPKTTWRLAELAQERGTTAVALVREVLAASATYTEAARTLGITTQALRQFRMRNGIEVARMKGHRNCPRCKGTGVVLTKRPVPGHDAEFYTPGGCEHGKPAPNLSPDSAKSGNEGKDE